MPPALAKALQLVAQHGAQIEGDWWIIGSTAGLLAGIEGFIPDDVDLFGSTNVMTAFVKSFGLEPVSSPSHHQFKSTPYQRIKLLDATPIEVMGGLEISTGGDWNRLDLKTRLPVSGFGAPLWIPSIEEQIAVFELFGRLKDLAKAKILRSVSI